MRPLFAVAALLALVTPAIVAVPATHAPPSWHVVAPPPDEVVAGDAVTFILDLEVPLTRLPSRIPLTGWDDAGGHVTTEPAVVETEPGVATYRVVVDHAAAEAGERRVTVRAEDAEVNVTVVVRRAPVVVDLHAGDVDAAWRLPVTVSTSTGVPDDARGTWHVRWWDPETGDEAAWTEDGGVVTVGPEAAPTTRHVTLKVGAGRYDLALELEGPLTAGLSSRLQVDAADPGPPSGTSPVVVEVPDDPLAVTLADDTVNADGKVKRPGETVISRLVVHDDNGLGDLVRVTATLTHGNRPVLQEDVPLPDDRHVRRDVALEHVVAWSPASPGLHVVAFTVWNASGAVATAQRTVNVTALRADVGAVSLERDHVLADEDVVVNVTVAVGSRSWAVPGDADGVVALRVYDGTRRLPWTARLADVTGAAPVALALPAGAHAVDGDRGIVTLDGAITVPAGVAGAFRVAVAWAPDVDGTWEIVGDATLTAHAVPTVTTLAADGEARPGDVLAVHVAVAHGERFDGVRVGLGDGDATLLAAPEGTVGVEVPTAAAGATLALRAEALAEGRVTHRLEVPVAVANVPPAVRAVTRVDGVPMAPLRFLPGVAQGLEATAFVTDANGDAPTSVTLRLVDWDGAVVVAAPASRDGGAWNARLPVPADLAAGGYVVEVVAVDPEGAEGVHGVAALVGGWAGVRVDAVHVEGRGDHLAGSTTVTNVGTLPLAGLHVRLLGDGPLGDGGTWTDGVVAGALGEPVTLANALLPGDAVTVTFRVPLAVGTPPGRYDGTLRVTGVLGAVA